MDKYEYNLKLDQMKSRYAEEKYDEAADIADTINWNKVKNVNGLVKAGEVYEKVQRYEESREVLLMAYDRSPIGRMIIYRLAEVAVKMKDFQAAQDYYDEFVEIAPHDTLKYVLRYDIQKAQGASYEELIPILEELKEQEYTEEWAYELAYLYHKAGMSEKCIDACDELVLWFGDGPYVERALELKMLYQPLTKTQEEKYRSFCQAKDDRAGLTHIDVEEMARAGETVHDPVAIPKVEVNTERFNTVNLQAEIAKGMQQIMDATEKETVTDTLDNINRMVEDVPYLKMQMEEEKPEAQPEQNTRHIETDEEIDGSLKTNFKELLGEDSDGQMSMMTNEKNMIEHQITGQMTIEEVLSEWEKMRKAAEVALEDARKRKLESAKARALQEAGDIMDRLTGVLPKLDAVLALLKDKLSAFAPGSPLDERTLMGPLANRQQYDKVLRLIQTARDEGDTIVCGGEALPGEGYFLQPTAVKVRSEESTLMREETFGPVCSFIGYRSEEEALARMNASPYGLAASVWSDNIRQALRYSEAIEAGIVWVNMHTFLDPAVPFGGMKGSGIGREFGSAFIDDYTELKSVMVRY